MFKACLKKLHRNKKGMEIEFLGWTMIALAVLVVIFIGYMILKSKGIDALEYLKNLIRFGN